MTKWFLTGLLAVAIGAGVLQTQQIYAQERAPLPGQGAVVAAPDVPVSETSLGQVRIPRKVMANGEPLAAGTYQVRLTTTAASPDAVGQTKTYERWVEFVRGGEVRGREVVTIIPAGEIATVAKDPAPADGGSKVEMLKGNEFLRVWFNRGGVHYLMHLPPA
jgi:hypothetical protein